MYPNMYQRPPSGRSGKVLGGILALVLAIVCCVIATNLSTAANKPAPTNTSPAYDPNPNAPVTCDGQVMSRNQVCDHITTINGHSSKLTYTYDQQQRYQSDLRAMSQANRTSDPNASQKQTNKTLSAVVGIICLASGLVGLSLLAQAARERR